MHSFFWRYITCSANDKRLCWFYSGKYKKIKQQQIVGTTYFLVLVFGLRATILILPSICLTLSASVEDNIPVNILFASFGLIAYQRDNFSIMLLNYFLGPEYVFKISLCTYIMPHILFFYRNFKQLSGEIEFMTVSWAPLRNLEILQNQVRST